MNVVRTTLPYDYDPLVREIWPQVSSRTMVPHEGVNSVVDAVRYVERNQIPGAVVECGVWRGGVMISVALTIERLGVAPRDLYLFDTFSGMTEPTSHDVHVALGTGAEETLRRRLGKAPIWEPASLDDVREGFEQLTDYPAALVHFVEGDVLTTIPGDAPDSIAILRLDTDWYESTRHELAHLYPRLSPGGVLILDDYGSWHGSKRATDEFLEMSQEPLFLTRVGPTRIAIKPGLTTRADLNSHGVG